MLKEQARYSRLANITKMIHTKLDLHEVLEYVTEAISEEIVQCDSVGIYLPQKDGTFRGYVGKPEVINGWTLDMHVIDTNIDLLAKEVIETKKTIYISDTSKDSRPDPRAVEGFQIKSLLVLPISFEDELFGLVFLFDYGIPMNLTDDEIQTVEAYVNMAAVAIQRRNNLIYKENLITEKQLLLDVTSDLAMCSSMQECLDTCFSYLGKVLENDNIGVHILDPIAERRMMPTKLSKDSDWSEEDWMKTHSIIKIDQSNDAVFQDVIKTKKAILIPDVYADDRPNHELCREFGMKGLFILPLVSMGEVLGLIPVVTLEEKITYTDAQVQLAQSIVDATASTLSNLLYMEKQEIIIEERTHEITVKNKELVRVVAELQQLGREKELLLNSAGEGIFGLDLERKITFCNPAGASMLGYDKECELIGQSSSIIFHGSIPEIQDREANAVDWEHFNEESQFFRKDHSNFPVEFVISSIKEGNEIVGEVVTFKDITQRKQMEEKIKYQAYYDSLTDLPNRVFLTDKLNQGIDQAKLNREKLALLYLDLDRFKFINDSLGHSYGDLLLRDVAIRLNDCVPKKATVSRQGGDEFTILLPNITGKKEVLNVVNQAIDSFTKPFHLIETEIYIKTSIGISLYPDHGDSTEILIKNADTAMYKSKEISGNSYHFFSEGMDTRTFETIKLENALYKALEKEELVLYYQPQINYKTNQLIGVEALIRWNHPEHGIISPDKFIPIAEDTGLIVSIGEWVLEEACRQLMKWHKQGNRISMSVNLSVRQFEQQDLFAVVKKVLERVGLSPKYLNLELTENLIVKNTTLTLRTMKKLKDLGIHLAIDDFGTGYSSLGYLKNMPINTLKIDKSFVRDMTKDDTAITNTILTLAQYLNLDVIAEGVETKEQAEFLAGRNCFLMQGYLFSPPMKAEDIAKKYLLN